MPLISVVKSMYSKLGIYAYTSFLLFGMCVYQALKQAGPRLARRDELPITLGIEGAKTEQVARLVRDTILPLLARYRSSESLADLTMLMLKEPFRVWVSVNAMFCACVVVGTALGRFVFGHVFTSEKRPIWEKFQSYVLNYCLYIFIIIKAQYVDELLFWGYWFLTLALLRATVALCKYRQIFMLIRSAGAEEARRRLLLLLALMLPCAVGMSSAAVFLGRPTHHYRIMMATVVQVTIRIFQTGLTVYMKIPSRPEKRTTLQYYTMFLLDITIRLASVSLLAESVARGWVQGWARSWQPALGGLYLLLEGARWLCSLVTLLDNHYRHITKYEDRLPWARPRELAANADHCPVCWDDMRRAKKLPCGHLFHERCLSTWLEKERTCPCCRALIPRRTPIRRPALNTVLAGLMLRMFGVRAAKLLVFLYAVKRHAGLEGWFVPRRARQVEQFRITLGREVVYGN